MKNAQENSELPFTEKQYRLGAIFFVTLGFIVVSELMSWFLPMSQEQAWLLLLTPAILCSLYREIDREKEKT